MLFLHYELATSSSFTSFSFRVQSNNQLLLRLRQTVESGQLTVFWGVSADDNEVYVAKSLPRLPGNIGAAASSLQVVTVSLRVHETSTHTHTHTHTHTTQHTHTHTFAHLLTSLHSHTHTHTHTHTRSYTHSSMTLTHAINTRGTWSTHFFCLIRSNDCRRKWVDILGSAALRRQEASK